VVREPQFVTAILGIDDPFAIQIEQVGAVVSIVHAAATICLLLGDELTDVLSQKVTLARAVQYECAPTSYLTFPKADVLILLELQLHVIATESRRFYAQIRINQTVFLPNGQDGGVSSFTASTASIRYALLASSKADATICSTHVARR
jgi:precorrin-4 methylase